MKIGIPKEQTAGETRVAATPDVVKRLLAKFADIEFVVEKGAGDAAYFTDAAFKEAGAKVADAAAVWKSDIILKVNPPSEAEAKQAAKGALVVGYMAPYANDALFKALAKAGVNALSVERIPRISRAQSMDALSSQANIGGYRAVIEAAGHYGSFMPVMMTAAGSSKPAKVMILGVGVAGLQAIATARRMGASVEAFDIRPETAEQVQSLGAKFISLDIGEEGAGEGGYAKELSEEGKRKQQAALQEYIKKADIVITTAQIPGRPAPVLVTEDAVKGMKAGSVIVDMAASSGGNCPLSKPDKVVEKYGVKIIGHSNYPAMVAADASQFYARNLQNLLQLLLKSEGGKTMLSYNLEDEIIAKSLVVYNGEVK